MCRIFVRLQRVAALALVLWLATPVSTLAEDCRCNGTNAAILDAMNEYRERQRLPPLRFERRLNAAAQDRIHDMFEQGYFDHIAPDGASPFTAIRRRGYRYFSAAENLASGPCSPRAVVDRWMRSSGHRANILGDFEDTGIAIVSGSPTHRSRGCTVVALYARSRS